VAGSAAGRGAFEWNRVGTAARQAARALLAIATALLMLALAPVVAGASESASNGGLASPAIVGGGGISITLAPWQVEVEEVIPVAGGEPLVFLCGGSILSTTKVLTAAHCVFNESKPVPAADILVTAGTSDFLRVEPEAEQVKVSAIRVHPDYVPNPDATEDIPDDVAVLNLEQPLVEGPSIRPIELAPAGASLPEGTAVDVAGFGEENPLSVPPELNGALNSIAVSLVSSHECGSKADAVFLCARTATGSVCFGDSGSGLTVPGSPAVPGAPAVPVRLVGVTDTVEDKCADDALGGFANVTAPEIRDFIEGNEAPPSAPRGGGSKIAGTPEVGQALTCQPGTWSGKPTFSYAFFDNANREVRTFGSSPTYAPAAAEVGRTILCEVNATTSGGTGTSRTEATLPIAAAPVLPVPQVQSITPSSGPLAGGTAVKINGSGFVAGATVTIGAAAAGVRFVSGSELTAKTPAGSGSREVIVSDAGGTSKGGPDFTYLPPPTVASVIPNTGPTIGGTAVTIKGSGFVAGATVAIGAAATEVKFVSSSELTARTPAGAGSPSVIISDPGGTSKPGPTFAYVGPPVESPTVASITPNTGPTAGGTAVEIKGSGFVSGATVTIGAAAKEVKFVSNGELTATTPPGSGTSEVIVTEGAETSKAGPKFTYVSPLVTPPPEVVVGIAPVLGAGTPLAPVLGTTLPHIENTTAGPSDATVVGATIAVQSGSTASVKVACRGTATCRGQLTLTTKSTVEFKGKPTLRTVPIGSASFSVLGGGSKTVKIKLGPVGRALLVSDHGRLSARLSIVKVEPAPRESQVKVVQLVAQRVHSAAK